MIRLVKGIEPEILATNKGSWLRDLNTEMDTGLTVNKAPSSKKYNQPTVKNSLMAESNGKCIYCESKIKHVDHGEIEHIKPKSKYPQEIFTWENMGFVCAICNNKKNDRYDPSIPIINPYIEGPSDYLVVVGAAFFARPGSDRAQITIETVELNRVELVERRNDRIKQLHTLLEKANRLPETLKKAVWDEIRAFVSESSEYSAATNAFLNAFS